MAENILFDNNSNIIRFTLKSSVTGQGLTGLSSASSGLIISTICDNEATATTYTVADSTIETITTLGTYATPTATKCRFKEVDATNHKGLYEFQFNDARFSVASSKKLIISVTGATNLSDTDYEIALVQYNPYAADTAQTGDLYGLLTSADTELSSIPTTTGTIINKIKFLFQYFRNKRTATTTTETLFKEDATTTLGTSSLTTDGITRTKGEMN